MSKVIEIGRRYSCKDGRCVDIVAKIKSHYHYQYYPFVGIIRESEYKEGHDDRISYYDENGFSHGCPSSDVDFRKE